MSLHWYGCVCRSREVLHFFCRIGRWVALLDREVGGRQASHHFYTGQSGGFIRTWCGGWVPLSLGHLVCGHVVGGTIKLHRPSHDTWPSRIPVGHLGPLPFLGLAWLGSVHDFGGGRDVGESCARGESLPVCRPPCQAPGSSACVGQGGGAVRWEMCVSLA